MRNVTVERTPIDTIDTAIEDLDRQIYQMEQAAQLSKKLKEGLTLARDKALAAFKGDKINLLPKPPQKDMSRSVGFLGAGLAARAVEVLEEHRGSMHVDDIFAIVSSQPGLAALSKESLRATLNSDAKQKHPRLVNLGQAVYDLAARHPKQRRLKAA
jgi:hypothetical protein